MLRFYYIYEITNDINGNTYIGRHNCPEGKTPENDKYMGWGVKLNEDKEKFGIEHFSKRVICLCHSEENLKSMERFFINLYKSMGKAEYNKDKTGFGGNSEVSKEMWKNPELRNKIIESRKGYITTEEHKRHISEALKGKSTWAKGTHKSEEHKEKIRQSNLGKKRSEETRKRNSEARKRWYAQGNKTRGTSGMHWYTNGIDDILCLEKDCPEGFIPGKHKTKS